MNKFLEKFCEVKKTYPYAVMLFRAGDYYEAYFEDAVDCAEILSVSLTHRSVKGMSYCVIGFPFHALDTHLPKLVRAGLKIAIAENINN